MDSQLEKMGIFPTLLFIKVVNGQPVDHPKIDINLEQVYGSIENIPSEYQPFMRVSQNVKPGPYQTPACSYQQIDGVWQDVWTLVDMTEAEILVRQQEIHNWATSAEEAVRRKIERRLLETSDENEIAVINQYIAILNAWELDLTAPSFPPPPVFNSETNSWFIPETD